MSRVVAWLLHYEQRMFFVVNRRFNHAFLDFVLARLTHLGGATFTIFFTLCITFLAPQPWSTVGLQSLIALTISHLPVALIKKLYPRMRPYLVLPKTNIGKNPLTDHSFPSGHTTAIFSVIIPFVLSFPWLGFIGIPLAAVVALSRIYLGLHYPSDCVAGSIIGSVSAVCTAALFGYIEE